MIRIYNPRRKISCRKCEVCTFIVLFIASLTIDFLPLPVFLDLLPLSSHVALHKLVNASFGYAVSFSLEPLCTLTITEVFSTQSKDSLFNLTKNKPSSTNFQLELHHFNTTANCIPVKTDSRVVEQHGYRGCPFLQSSVLTKMPIFYNWYHNCKCAVEVL